MSTLGYIVSSRAFHVPLFVSSEPNSGSTVRLGSAPARCCDAQALHR